MGWLLEQVERYGWVRVLSWPVVAVGLLTGAGLITDSGAALWVGVGLLVVLLAAGVGILLFQLRASHEIVRQQRRVMDHMRSLVESVMKEHGSDPALALGRTLLYRDDTQISTGGDAVVRTTLTVEPANRPIHYLRVKASGEPVSARTRRKMRFEARLVPESARLPLVTNWTSDRHVEVWAFLPEPPRPGDGSRTVAFTWDWPGLFPGIVGRGSDSVGWKLESEIDRLEYCVTFGRELGIGSPVRLTTEGLTTLPEQRSNGGSWEVSGELSNIPPHKRVNITFELG